MCVCGGVWCLIPVQWCCRLHRMATGQENRELVFPLPTAFRVASPELADDSCG